MKRIALLVLVSTALALGCGAPEEKLGENHKSICYMDDSGVYQCDDGGGGGGPEPSVHYTQCVSCPPTPHTTWPGFSYACASAVACCLVALNPDEPWQHFLVATQGSPLAAIGCDPSAADLTACDYAVGCACGAGPGFVGLLCPTCNAKGDPGYDPMPPIEGFQLMCTEYY